MPAFIFFLFFIILQFIISFTKHAYQYGQLASCPFADQSLFDDKNIEIQIITNKKMLQSWVINPKKKHFFIRHFNLTL